MKERCNFHALGHIPTISIFKLAWLRPLKFKLYLKIIREWLVSLMNFKTFIQGSGRLVSIQDHEFPILNQSASHRGGDNGMTTLILCKTPWESCYTLVFYHSLFCVELFENLTPKYTPNIIGMTLFKQVRTRRISPCCSSHIRLGTWLGIISLISMGNF
jgi:hypothetical protein